jgi:hypothetical protein
MQNAEKNLVEYQDKVQEKNDIKKKVSFEFAEQNKIFVQQEDDQAYDRDHVFQKERHLRCSVEKFYHKRIQLFSSLMDNFQRKIGIEHTQNQYRSDQDQVFCIVTVNVIVLVLLFPASMSSFAFERVFAEGGSG